MSGNATDPSLGVAGEPVVRKRGRPKQAKTEEPSARKRARAKQGKIDDDGAADSKRQKINTWPNASGIGIRSGGKTLPPQNDNNALEINNHGHAQQGLKRQTLKNLAVMTSKRNAIPSGGGNEESAASRNNDLSTTAEDVSSERDLRGGAWEAVLQVHGICTPAKGGAAIFPGEAGGGQEGGDGRDIVDALCAICRQPEIKRQTIICDGCEQSFHVSCVRLSSERANNLDDWACPSCAPCINASGGTRGYSNLSQQYLDKKLVERAMAVGKAVAQKGGRAKKPESAPDENQRGLDLNEKQRGLDLNENQRGLDLNVPPEAHEGLDRMRSQNGPADQNFR